MQLSKKLFIGGLCSLVGSSLLLYLSLQAFASDDPSGNWSFALLLLSARLLGIAAFLLGVWLMFLGHWTKAVVLVVGSIALPMVSFYLTGSI